MFKSSLIVMLINMLSRILGLIREIVIAAFFGATGHTDAYFASSRIANFFTTLLGEGSLGTAFIPIYNEIKEENNLERANSFVFNLTNLIVSFSFTISLFTALFSDFTLKYILKFKDAEMIATASILLKIMSFYLVFISVSGLISSLLNNYGKFYISTLVGVVFNLTIIIGALLTKNSLGIYGLGISFLLSGLFQVLIQLPSFLKILKTYKFTFDYKDKYVKKFFLLMIPTLVGIFGYQINELVDTAFAGSLKLGTISAINYASRLYLLPIGVFAISLSVVIFPDLSKSVLKKNNELFKTTIERGMNLLAILIIPSSLGLIYYSREIITLLFNRGKFTLESVELTSEILEIYAIGLIFFSTIHLLTRAHYANKDRKLPVISSLIAITINIFLDFLLYKKFTHRGLTFATTFSALVNYLILLISLKARYSNVSLLKYFKFIIISLLNSIICIFVIEKIINISNKNLEIIIKLFMFIILYFAILSLKYIKDKKEILDR
ncbi:murein biosynthesis integral membrane protein MurJ [Streptobacillus moniliformis]|uniref:Probable lipid II flippase MurJ n=2 Tax=Streptobacillus moniliformis TaxID=34105 RepID=D1AY55_STRM9|nr:murein biosynthesis integral membrane protein MurJ [Streptobacillus moniliformis]ACZ01231.1 integral membrane protein MviN [Streptobacillus moniliformis DSM 12112]AVL42410.1 murein biosynthesis integral membrane protein MurJ [Streptobacillus moniliformis]QXW65977.1 murein biosynthesis integral membrane protein MurJ [Streptobacillus moniliformis]SQA13614.1 integral membrane protein MviN [Streptobacillus moniliformis]